jgi:hypothetical protein
MDEDIGIVLVHGIGEQSRFEHLDGELRNLIEGLRREGSDLRVEIQTAEAEANLAKQASWRGGPRCAVRIFLRDSTGARKTFHVHEVWWADVNEPYSLAKQLRFWLWGLTVWWFPGKLASTHEVAQSVMVPVEPSPCEQAMARAKIFWVSSFFLSLSLTVGLASSLAKRLLNQDPPDLLRTFVNYLGSIKLYNQQVRRGLGFPLGARADFLDALGESPRVSIRRRMACVLADVACASYDRWYVLAHSLGSVVAFNGLMEPGYVFPNYLDEARWRTLKDKGFAGPRDPKRPAVHIPPKGAVVTPRRPPWLAGDDVAYRSKMFEKMGGLLTYGCPLGKFADIWPALVPYCAEPAFQPGAVWINAFDPIDPVSGLLRNMDLAGSPGAGGLLCAPPRRNIGYASTKVILQAHVEYLAPKKDRADLVGLIAGWLVRNDPNVVDPKANSRVYADSDRRVGRRNVLLVLEWVLVYGLTACATFGAAAAIWIFALKKTLTLQGAGWVFLAAVILPPIVTWLFGATARLLPKVFEPDRDALVPPSAKRPCRSQKVTITPL